MSNHYHLALELDKPEEISSFIAGLQRSYSCYHHRTYGTSGFLWQGRFKLQPVQKDIYLSACEYPYSNAAFYCLGRNDGLTTEDSLFSDFGKTSSDRQRSYREFLQNFDREEEADPPDHPLTHNKT